MFTLDQPTEAYTIELPFDVRVRVRPLTQAVSNTATAYATRRFREMAQAQAEQLALGIAAPDAPDLADPDVREGIIQELWNAGLARHGIMSWEGVGNADGTEALPCTPETREAFGRSRLGGLFIERYDQPLRKARAEGNGSAPGPNGASAPGATTAPDAPPSATNALVH